ncbi:hypothetical protein Esti_000280 [Eimeria stiedai]
MNQLKCSMTSSGSACSSRSSSNNSLPLHGYRIVSKPPERAAAAAATGAAPAAAERGRPLLRVGSRWSPLALQQTKQVLRKVVFAAADRFPAAVAAFLEETQQQQQQEQEVLAGQCSESLASSAAGALNAAAAARLRQRLRYGEVQIIPYQTAADRQLQQQLLQLGGKGLFSKELEEGLVRGEIDLAVHSLKDVATALCPGTSLAALLPRTDPRDLLLFSSANKHQLKPLLDAIAAAAAAKGAANSKQTLQVTCSGSSSSSSGEEILIGSSSLRRQSLLRFLAGYNPAAAAAAATKVHCVSLRGNVQTRLRKLREGTASATLLAAAGLKRLSLLQQQPPLSPAAATGCVGLERLVLRPPYEDIEAALLPLSVFTPAVGQGIVASQCRSSDASTLELLQAVNDPAAATAAAAERAFLAQLDGSCRTPLGAIALLQQQQHVRQQQQQKQRARQQQQQQQHLDFRGFVGEPDGSRMYHAAAAAAVRTPEEAAEVGAAAARAILEEAGDKFVSDIISKVQGGWGSLKQNPKP